MRLDVNIKTTLYAGKQEFLLRVNMATCAQRLVLFGPSGSGKSLTLKAIAGLLRPDQGQIRIEGKTYFDSEKGVYLQARERKVAYLFQDYALFPQLTVRQNIAFGLKKGIFNPRKTEQFPDAEFWLDAFELRELATHYPCQLSGGQKQRTALARALVSQPGLLLLDEPFAALDSLLRHRLRREVNELLAKLNVPIILITHDPDDALMFGEEVCCFEKGAVTTKLSREEFFQKIRAEKRNEKFCTGSLGSTYH